MSKDQDSKQQEKSYTVRVPVSYQNTVEIEVKASGDAQAINLAIQQAEKRKYDIIKEAVDQDTGVARVKEDEAEIVEDDEED